MSDFIAYQDIIQVLQPASLVEEDFENRLRELQKQQPISKDFRETLLNEQIDIISWKRVLLEVLDSIPVDYYEVKPLKTSLIVYPDKLNGLTYVPSKHVSPDDMVCICSLGEYSVEVKYENHHFKQHMKRNGTDIDVPFWLSDVQLSIEQRWKDLGYIFEKNEGIHLPPKYINEKQTIWILRKNTRLEKK